MPKKSNQIVSLSFPFDILRRAKNEDIERYRINKFISRRQLAALNQLCAGEEGEWFSSKRDELIKIFANMPYSYQQRENKLTAKDNIAYIHYFQGGMDYWVCEKDIDHDGEGQIQAFGLVSHAGNYPELGYFSIPELLQHNFEIDLHWNPKRVSEINASL